MSLSNVMDFRNSSPPTSPRDTTQNIPKTTNKDNKKVVFDTPSSSSSEEPPLSPKRDSYEKFVHACMQRRLPKQEYTI